MAYGHVGVWYLVCVDASTVLTSKSELPLTSTWFGLVDVTSGLDSNSSSLLPLLSSPASPVALLITIVKRTAEIGFALATKTSYNHSRAEHRLAKGDDVVDVIHSQS